VRFSIERLRALVLVAGVLLVAALIVFLARGRLKNPLNLKDLPGKMGLNITQDASGFTLDHSTGGHSRYRIHASKVAQFTNDHAILHDVQIDLFGQDGSRVDRIEGAEFDYDQKAGTALAAGAVEITLTRPSVAPAVAPKASTSAVAKGKATPVASAAEAAERGEIHVKTSGLSFDTRSGLAQTSQHVDFSMAQGGGSSMGASYNSKGFLVLDKTVELNTERNGEKVLIHAAHAEFDRDTLLCRLHAATADYRGGQATAGDAKVLFRKDGSAVRLDATNGFNMLTATGSHIAAPTGSMDFDEHNQPQRGELLGGVTMDSTRPAQDGAGQRRMRGTAPTAKLEFDGKGELRHVHLERGVAMQSETLSEAANIPLRVSRTWNSPVADVDFRDDGHGQAEVASIHGVEGVVVTGESQRGKGPVVPSRLAADDMTGTFGPASVLKELVGTGHASLEETSATGTHETSAGDRLDVHMLPPGSGSAAGQGGAKPGAGDSGTGQGGAGQIQSALLDGHVLLTQQPAAKAGAPVPALLRAWAGRAEYEGTGEWLHLTESPRIEDGGLQMTADKVDVSHQSGDAFAHGNVKATWFSDGKTGSTANQAAATQTSSTQAPAAQAPAAHGDAALGGQGPAHVISNDAEFEQATGVATFKGHARLWQQANSVAGPVIVLDRQKQTLTAHSADPGEPVKAVLLSAGGLETGAANHNGGVQAAGQNTDKGAQSKTPSVVTVRGGDLKYSDAERKAWMRRGALGTVDAETATAKSVSDNVELVLLPPGNHAGRDGGQAQVDRMTARGHVVVTSGGRRGTGEQLVYTGEDGQYVLTGTSAVPPRMTDPTRGNVTGEALVFHSRDDSVTIEGGGGRTTTQTTAPK
jgi:lipopolysaccharide export system protein LptA